ncbi:MAG: hypothetical protein BRC29_02145 [Nanohaloarchaea archaeon SW_7_43_1]|nr:MAG: hypothetical protein BRC29_02145 [Nanohaloarchaea archaeon SW_7_43_1]
MKSKGQVFIIAAVIFGSLLILTFISIQQVFLVERGVSTQFYFEGALEQQSKVVDQAVAENYSSGNVRNELYSFNSFVNSTSSSKGIDYSAFQLTVLPEKETAVLINYRDQDTSYNFYNGSWTNKTLEPLQYEEISVSEDREEFRFEAEKLNVSDSFNTTSPLLLGHVKVSTEYESWSNYILR